MLHPCGQQRDDGGTTGVRVGRSAVGETVAVTSGTPALSALVLPDRHPVSAFLAEVQEAEQAGVRAVWTYDHLTWPLLADGPWYGAVPLLAAAAMATKRVRLGT